MSYSLETTDMDLGDTAIENIFLNDYMPMANGTHVKVYLLGFKYAADRDNNIEINNKTIAKHLQISLEDVLNAWDFWEEKGIIKKIKSSHDDYENKYNYKVEFLSLKQLYIRNNYNILNDKEKTDDERPREVTENDVIQLNKNPEINHMFNKIQDILKRPTQISEKRRILSWLQNFNMNPDVILKAFEYASSKENLTKSAIISYVEGVIRNWYDDGISNLEQVQEDFKRRDEEFYRYDRIMRALGRYDLPTTGEKKIIDSWFNEYDWDMDMILEACRRSTASSDPNINYINGILKNWKKKDLSTVAQVEEYMEKREMRNKKYRAIGDSLGRKSSINPAEKELVDKWIDEYGLGMDIILEACRQAVERRKANFNYMNVVIDSWYAKGVNDLEDIEKLDENFERKVNIQASKSDRNTRRNHDHTTKFHNFEQRSDNYTAEELEDVFKRKREKYMKEIKGE